MADRSESRRRYDAKRADAPARKWYATRAWQARRKEQLHRIPWCEYCKEAGRTTPAGIANHDPPHRGDRIAFFFGPLRSACKACHDSPIQRAELAGFSRNLDADGWPADARHPFNKKSKEQQ